MSPTVVALPQEGFCRIDALIKPHGVFGVCRAKLYSDIAAGLLPAPRKFGTASLWSVKEVRAALKRIEDGEMGPAYGEARPKMTELAAQSVAARQAA